MGLPQDLLEQADHLAKRDKKRPKQASLRRAVSTSYYALFHLLVSEAVTYWKLERQRSLLARSFEHRKMKGICAKGRYSDPDLQAVADAFVELQQARHLADYDYAKVFTRTEVAVLAYGARAGRHRGGVHGSKAAPRKRMKPRPGLLPLLNGFCCKCDFSRSGSDSW